MASAPVFGGLVDQMPGFFESREVAADLGDHIAAIFGIAGQNMLSIPCAQDVHRRALIKKVIGRKIGHFHLGGRAVLSIRAPGSFQPGRER